MIYGRFWISSFIIFISSMILSDSLSLYKYDVDVDHIEHPMESDLVHYGTLRVKKFNRTTFVVVGYMDLMMEFTDEFHAILEIYTLAGNEYRKILDRSARNICTFIKDDKMVTAKIINATSMAPKIEECPIPPQRIYFNNLKMPTDNLPVDPRFLKKGMLKVNILLGTKLMTNASIYFEITRVNQF